MTVCSLWSYLLLFKSMRYVRTAILSKAEEKGKNVRPWGSGTRQSNTLGVDLARPRGDRKKQEQCRGTRLRNKAEEQGRGTRQRDKAEEQGRGPRRRNRAVEQGRGTRQSYSWSSLEEFDWIYLNSVTRTYNVGVLKRHFTEQITKSGILRGNCISITIRSLVPLLV